MLHEIYCEQFHQKRIVFNPGLSVVLGTNTGDNSIGKSSFLLIVDYVFGGSTYGNGLFVDFILHLPSSFRGSKVTAG